MFVSFLHGLHRLKLDAVGPHAVRAGQKVHVTDSLFALSLWQTHPHQDRVRDIQILFQLAENGALPESLSGIPETSRTLTLRAFTALFGVDFNGQDVNLRQQTGQMPWQSLKLMRPSTNTLGCNSYHPSSISSGVMIVVDRGDCTFVEKLRYASNAGASGAIVISDNDEALNPSFDSEEHVDDLADSGLVVLTRTSGRALLEFMELAQRQNTFVTMEMEPEPGFVEGVQQQAAPSMDNTPNGEIRYIFLGGKPILNMVILA
jgi:mannosidase alpha-like ER degradation enhancer 1